MILTINLSEWIKHLKDTVEAEELAVEKISKRVFGTFCLDMDRLNELHGKVRTKELTHPTQCRPNDISGEFSDFRDELGLYNELPKKNRPTFHEIRSLSIFLYGKQGLDPLERAAHTDAKTTKKYMEGHIEWVQIQTVELKI